MKYYATIYIDPITDWQGFTHAFLGLTHNGRLSINSFNSNSKALSKSVHQVVWSRI